MITLLVVLLKVELYLTVLALLACATAECEIRWRGVIV